MEATVWLLIMLQLCNIVACASGRSKEVERSYRKCKDDRPGCKEFVEQCSKMKIIQKYCKKTCGLCSSRADAPPVDCRLTKFGCCWDNETIAKGKYNDGCPACADQYKECKYFREQCEKQEVLKTCPVTCGVKCTQCMDNKHQASVCPLYKQYNFCHISPDLMEKMCSRTCGFCKS